MIMFVLFVADLRTQSEWFVWKAIWDNSWIFLFCG